jgi:hypothetical protein
MTVKALFTMCKARECSETFEPKTESHVFHHNKCRMRYNRDRHLWEAQQDALAYFQKRLLTQVPEWLALRLRSREWKLPLTDTNSMRETWKDWGLIEHEKNTEWKP